MHAIVPNENPEFCRKSRGMIRYAETREVIHFDGSKPPKLGSYNPTLPYLVVKRA